jgi:hypothetical protein
MTISSNYLVQTRNRLVVGVVSDSLGGTVSFGITASAFTNGILTLMPSDAPAFFDPRITTSSASLSKFSCGVSGGPVTIGFGSTASGAPGASGGTSVCFILTTGVNEMSFERFTIPNGVTSNPNGQFYVNVPVNSSVSAYLEFVPF